MTYGSFDAWEPTIPGWSSDILPFYDRMARELPTGAHAVEVGVYRGRSLLFLATRLRELGKMVLLHGVDVWDGSDEASHRPDGDCYRACVDDAGRLGVAYMIRFAVMPSDVASGMMPDRSLDLVFIDAQHTYEGVREDIALWTPKVRAGGVLAGHDYSGSFPGVAQAVHEAFGNAVRVTDSVWEVRR